MRVYSRTLSQFWRLSSKVRVAVDTVFDENLFLSWCLSLSQFSHGRNSKGVLFIWAPIHNDCDLVIGLKVPPPNTHIWEQVSAHES